MMDILVSLSEVVCTEFRKYRFIDLLILSMKIYEYSLCVHKCAVLCAYRTKMKHCGLILVCTRRSHYFRKMGTILDLFGSGVVKV